MAQWRPLRVQIVVGQQDIFSRVLATNIQCWGYEARVQALEEIYKGQGVDEFEGDILLYDIDAWPFKGAMDKGAITVQHGLLALEGIRSYNKQWSQPRYIIVLSSRSMSRMMLEQIGAIALLPKPFEMGRLQRYLKVLYRLVLADMPGNALPLHHLHKEKDIQRVLIVDDDEIIAHSIEKCLSYEPGYEVAVAHDGLEALELALDWQPHCIVTDLIMPWMNGYQVMRCLAGSSLRAMPAFVVMSALTQLEHPDQHSYLRGKAVTYVDKPFHIDHLLSAIRQVCIENRCQTA